MAEAVLFSTAEGIINSSRSLALEEVGLLWGFKVELQKLRDTVSIIQPVLLDAEMVQARNHAVKHWILELKDAMYDTDDLLDDFSTELLRREMMTRNKKVKQVCKFFSMSNQLGYGFKMGHRIKAARVRLDEIADLKNRFGLNERSIVTQFEHMRREDTYSFVREEEVIGREDEKKAIKELLFDSDVKEDVSIIPIVGIGGLGKTTLAQYVFNDEEVLKHFNLRLWACVSDHFDIKTIIVKLIEFATHKRSESHEMSLLKSQFLAAIDGRRYLLVLDDVWNENPNTWLDLKNLLVGGRKGSKVLITTRSKNVAAITSSVRPFILRGLSETNSWNLFKKMAFKDGEEPEDQRLVKIGKNIVRKCAQVPLAIRSIGSLLYFNNSIDDWLYFENSEFYKIAQNDIDIFPILQLSYNHLPQRLKQCFAFCSLFPKDHEIEVEVLIQLWIAQGFIHCSDRTKCLEDVGHKYFLDLLNRSFIQDIQINAYGDIERCKMHDLIHDLAQAVAGNECTMSNPSAEKVCERTRHVTLDSLSSSRDINAGPLLKADKMRTLLLRFPTRPSRRRFPTWPSHLRCPTRPSHLRFPTKPSSPRFPTRPRHLETVYDTLISSFKCLRALNLSASNIQEVPNSIGKLNHLRFLDLSWNIYIKLLPTSITKLQNLQTLRLDFCSGLKELPEDTRNLISLRHLALDECSSLTYMPHGLGKLTALRTLTQFIVGKKEVPIRKGGLGNLDGLNELRGELRIKGLEHLRSYPLEANDAILERKQHLRSLILDWDPEAGDVSDKEIENDEHILEKLRPHLNLKKLIIAGYAGVRLCWLSSLLNLVSIFISDCKRCQHIPPLDQFPFLKSLSLFNLSALEYLSNDGSGVSSSSLESLELSKLPKLKGWWRMRETVTVAHVPRHHFPVFPSFPCLSSLYIKNCPMMSLIPVVAPGSETTPSSSSPFSDLSKLKSLFLESVEELESLPEEWLQNLTSLKTLNILWCRKLRISISAIFQHLTALEDLQISNCRELISNEDEEDAQCLGPKRLRYLYIENVTSLVYLPRELRHFTSLHWLDIKNCTTLMSLPEWIGDFTSLQKLQIINCPNLISLPEGICRLTSLCYLTIAECHLLEKRCKRGGVDWPKIAHVPEFSNQQFY